MCASRAGAALQAVAVVLCLAASGCFATAGGSTALRQDLDSLRLSVDRLRQGQAECTARLEAETAPTPSADAEMEILLLRDQMDALEAQLRSVALRLQGTDESVGSLSYDIARMEARTVGIEKLARLLMEQAATGDAAAGGEDIAADTVAPGADAALEPAPRLSAVDDPSGLFQKAYADYSRGDYELATMGFTSLLQLRPEGSLADDAVYYLAEIAAARGNPVEALGGYARVVEEYPGADKVPAAILKRGLLLLEANRIGEGVVQLDHLVKSYPASEEARLARNKLRALGVGP